MSSLRLQPAIRRKGVHRRAKGDGRTASKAHTQERIPQGGQESKEIVEQVAAMATAASGPLAGRVLKHGADGKEVLAIARGTCLISSVSSPTLSSRRTQRLKRRPYRSAISFHITTLRKILSSPEPIDIRLWTRSGEIQSWHRCISLKYDFYKGTRRMKLLDSNEIRQLRVFCIFEVNGLEVYM